MINIIHYLDIPYVDDGRDWSGCDCYGLFMLWYATELGIKIADLSFRRGCDFSLEALEQLYTGFRRVDTPRLHDIVMIKKVPDLHIGVCLSSKEFIHTLETVGCHVADIHIWKKHIIGFYRHINTFED